MRYNQDIYKTYGMDISKDPAIMATVYNLGRPKERAIAAQEAKRDPRVNYFGFFVNKYMVELEAAVGTPIVEAPKPTVPKAPTVVQKAGDPNAEAKPASLPEVKKVLKPIFSENVSLVLAPPGCDLSESYGATDIERKYQTYQNFAVAGIANKGKSFEVLSPGLDCESEPWSLVRTSNGVTGWIKQSRLDQSSKKVLVPEDGCKEVDNKTCRAAVKKASEKQIIEDTTQSSLVFLKLVSKQKEVTYKKHAYNCREDEASGQAPSAGAFNNFQTAIATPGNGSVAGGVVGMNGGFGGIGGAMINGVPVTFNGDYGMIPPGGIGGIGGGGGARLRANDNSGADKKR